MHFYFHLKFIALFIEFIIKKCNWWNYTEAIIFNVVGARKWGGEGLGLLLWKSRPIIFYFLFCGSLVKIRFVCSFG